MRARRGAALAGFGVWAILAACVTREPETRPFRIEASRTGVGPLETGVTEPTVFVFDGIGRRRDETTLVVENATTSEGGSAGDVTVTFHREGAPEVAFPPQLDGQRVSLTVDVDPTSGGPEGEPLPIHGVLVATGAPTDLRYQFIIGEFSSDGSSAIAIRPAAPDQDAPWFQVVFDWAQFEPGECGPVYYDALEVQGDDENLTLRHGEQGQLSIGAPEEPPWKALNVVSWHRRGSCGTQAKAWTQLAAWR